MIKTISESKDETLKLSIGFYSDNSGRAFAENSPSAVKVLLIDTEYKYKSSLSTLENFDVYVLQTWIVGKARTQRDAEKIGRTYITNNNLRARLVI